MAPSPSDLAKELLDVAESSKDARKIKLVRDWVASFKTLAPLKLPEALQRLFHEKTTPLYRLFPISSLALADAFIKEVMTHKIGPFLIKDVDTLSTHQQEQQFRWEEVIDRTLKSISIWVTGDDLAADDETETDTSPVLKTVLKTVCAWCKSKSYDKLGLALTAEMWNFLAVVIESSKKAAPLARDASVLGCALIGKRLIETGDLNSLLALLDLAVLTAPPRKKPDGKASIAMNPARIAHFQQVFSPFGDAAKPVVQRLSSMAARDWPNVQFEVIEMMAARSVDCIQLLPLTDAFSTPKGSQPEPLLSSKGSKERIEQDQSFLFFELDRLIIRTIDDDAEDGLFVIALSQVVEVDIAPASDPTYSTLFAKLQNGMSATFTLRCDVDAVYRACSHRSFDCKVARPRPQPKSRTKHATALSGPISVDLKPIQTRTTFDEAETVRINQASSGATGASQHERVENIQHMAASSGSEEGRSAKMDEDDRADKTVKAIATSAGVHRRDAGESESSLSDAPSSTKPSPQKRKRTADDDARGKEGGEASSRKEVDDSEGEGEDDLTLTTRPSPGKASGKNRYARKKPASITGSVSSRHLGSRPSSPAGKSKTGGRSTSRARSTSSRSSAGPREDDEDVFDQFPAPTQKVHPRARPEPAVPAPSKAAKAGKASKAAAASKKKKAEVVEVEEEQEEEEVAIVEEKRATRKGQEMESTKKGTAKKPERQSLRAKGKAPVVYTPESLEIEEEQEEVMAEPVAATSSRGSKKSEPIIIIDQDVQADEGEDDVMDLIDHPVAGAAKRTSPHHTEKGQPSSTAAFEDVEMELASDDVAAEGGTGEHDVQPSPPPSSGRILQEGETQEGEVIYGAQDSVPLAKFKKAAEGKKKASVSKGKIAVHVDVPSKPAPGKPASKPSKTTRAAPKDQDVNVEKASTKIASAPSKKATSSKPAAVMQTTGTSGKTKAATSPWETSAAVEAMRSRDELPPLGHDAELSAIYRKEQLPQDHEDPIDDGFDEQAFPAPFEALVDRVAALAPPPQASDDIEEFTDENARPPARVQTSALSHQPAPSAVESEYGDENMNISVQIPAFLADAMDVEDSDSAEGSPVGPGFGDFVQGIAATDHSTPNAAGRAAAKQVRVLSQGQVMGGPEPVDARRERAAGPAPASSKARPVSAPHPSTSTAVPRQIGRSSSPRLPQPAALAPHDRAGARLSAVVASPPLQPAVFAPHDRAGARLTSDLAFSSARPVSRTRSEPATTSEAVPRPAPALPAAPVPAPVPTPARAVVSAQPRLLVSAQPRVVLGQIPDPAAAAVAQPSAQRLPQPPPALGSPFIQHRKQDDVAAMDVDNESASSDAGPTGDESATMATAPTPGQPSSVYRRPAQLSETPPHARAQPSSVLAFSAGPAKQQSKQVQPAQKGVGRPDDLYAVMDELTRALVDKQNRKEKVVLGGARLALKTLKEDTLSIVQRQNAQTDQILRSNEEMLSQLSLADKEIRAKTKLHREAARASIDELGSMLSQTKALAASRPKSFWED